MKLESCQTEHSRCSGYVTRTVTAGETKAASLSMLTNDQKESNTNLHNNKGFTQLLTK